MGVGLHLQLPAARSLRARPRDLHRRCRASGLAVRRARRQFRHPGCGESGLEACRRAERARAVPHLIESYDTGTHPGGGREYRSFDPLDRFHVAAHQPPSGGCAMGCWRLRRTPNSRAAWSFRPAVAAGDLRHAAVDTRHGTVWRQRQARRAAAGRAASPRRRHADPPSGQSARRLRHHPCQERCRR